MPCLDFTQDGTAWLRATALFLSNFDYRHSLSVAPRFEHYMTTFSAVAALAVLSIFVIAALKPLCAGPTECLNAPPGTKQPVGQ